MLGNLREFFFFPEEIECAWEMAGMRKMAFQRESSRDEGSESGVELVDKHRVEAFPIRAPVPPSSTNEENEIQGALVWMTECNSR